MKIGFIGDLHLGAGYSLGKIDKKTQLNFRLLDFFCTYNSILDNFTKRGVEHVVITGDVFDTKHPTSAQLNMFSKCIRNAVDKGMSVIVLAGNHDQQRLISTTTLDVFGSLELPGFYFYNKMKLHRLSEDMSLLIMPYQDRKMLKVSSNSEAVSLIDEEIKDICSSVKGKKIAVGHFMIDKAVTGQDGENFSMSEIVIPSNIFDNFDAVVMGHVHEHSIIKKDPMITYVGSMDKISFGERLHKKVAMVFDSDNIKEPEILTNRTRSLFRINLDYSAKILGSTINSKILSDIDKFDTKFVLKNSIVQLDARVNENDLYLVNREHIYEYIKKKNVKHIITPLKIFAPRSRKLRDRKITETVSGKDAMKSFVNSLSEPEETKKKILKFANKVIEEVENK